MLESAMIVSPKTQSEVAEQASRTEILTWSISRGLGERFRRRAMLGNGSE
jgi:hypothetical protein